MMMCKCEDNFYDPNRRINIKHRCVAHLYALFGNDLNDEVSDTTKLNK